MPPRFQWAQQQLDVFDVGLNDSRHLIVESRAGTAKTTTAVELVRRFALDPRYRKHRVLLCAFNTRIRDELVEKITRELFDVVPERERSVVEIAGVHQLGWALVRGAFRGIRFDDNKTFGIACEVLINNGLVDDRKSDRYDKEWMKRVLKLVSLAKYTLAASEDALLKLAQEFDLVDEDLYPSKIIVPVVVEILTRSISDTQTADHDDQVWFPVRYDLRPRAPYDLVIGDEVQDWNHAELWIIRRMLSNRGRLVLFGDPRQAIYGWKGAASNAMQQMEHALEHTSIGCQTLRLTTTYRCPKKVVEEARMIVPDYDAAPEAPEGDVRRVTRSQMFTVANPGDVVLSRINAPLGSICLSFVRRGKSAWVVGRDFGESMIALIKKSRTYTPDTLVDYLEARLKVLRDKYDETGARDKQLENAIDLHDTLRLLAEECASIPELNATIERLFRDKGVGNAITCSTVHKAKGLEWPNVFLLKDTFDLIRAKAKTDEDKEQEDNTLYVGITRAQQTLLYVHPDPKNPTKNTSPKQVVLRKGGRE